MILQKEIATISEQLGVSKSVIDKDWMLGHFIAAIFNEPELKETLIFKGGTCLKKCWFEEYRFSEDLDFTSKSQEFKLTLDPRYRTNPFVWSLLSTPHVFIQ